MQCIFTQIHQTTSIDIGLALMFKSVSCGLGYM